MTDAMTNPPLTTPADVLAAVEVLLRAGYPEQAVSILASAFKDRHELREAMMGGVKL